MDDLDAQKWAERIVSNQKLEPGSPYLHGQRPPTPGQIAAVLHALADHTGIVNMLEWAKVLGEDRSSLGADWVMATGVGRYLQRLGGALESPVPDDALTSGGSTS